MFTRFGRAHRPRSAAFVRRPHRTPFAASAIALGVLTFSASAFAQTGAPLTLEEALQRAADADPRLRAAEAGVEAAEAGARQARARLNPVLDLEVENFGGSDSLRGFDGAESTFRLSQPLERGGRRDARAALADRELSAAEVDALIRRLDVFEEVQRAFFEALAADELVEIATERLETAIELQRSVDRRVAAARDPLMAGARAAAGTAEARIALDAARRDAATARATLASFWNGDEGFVLADVFLELPAGATHGHEQPEGGGPDLARADAERQRAAAAVRLERSRGFLDPVLSLGVRRFERDGETGLVAGMSIPLGIFDRNSGGIARARAEERRADFNAQAARLRIQREAAALERHLSSAAASVTAMDRDVIPQAERALALARDGYNQGAFSYLDVLEAQRALSASRAARIEALRTFHNTEAALDRLTARFADGVRSEEILP